MGKWKIREKEKGKTHANITPKLLVCWLVGVRKVLCVRKKFMYTNTRNAHSHTNAHIFGEEERKFKEGELIEVSKAFNILLSAVIFVGFELQYATNSNE